LVGIPFVCFPAVSSFFCLRSVWQLAVFAGISESLKQHQQIFAPLCKKGGICCKAVRELFPKLSNQTFERIPQDDALASYWRKRDKKDGEINFKEDSRTIYNLIRALTKPYVGAHVIYNNQEVKIWKAKEVEGKFENKNCGEVLEVFNNKILVKCAENAIFFLEHEFKDMPKIGGYLE